MRLERFENDLRDAYRFDVGGVAKQHAALGKRFSQNLSILVGHLNARHFVHSQGFAANSCGSVGGSIWTTIAEIMPSVSVTVIRDAFFGR